MVYHNSLAIQPIKESILESKAETLRIRNWKDRTESELPILRRDIYWLEKILNMKTADRYPRKEVEKDLKHINEMMRMYYEQGRGTTRIKQY